MAQQIELAGGRFATVDDEDFESLRQFKWHCSRAGYARRGAWDPLKGRNKGISMHRQIMGFPEGMSVDHINGDRLDNRRSNLRICTHKQNCRNTGPRFSRKYKGVYSCYGGKTFAVKLWADGKLVHVGTFRSEEEAAKAYDDASARLFGEFSRANLKESK